MSWIHEKIHTLTWWQEVWESIREQRQETAGTGGGAGGRGTLEEENLAKGRDGVGACGGAVRGLAVTKREHWWVDPALKIAWWRGRQGWAAVACNTVYHDISISPETSWNEENWIDKNSCQRESCLRRTVYCGTFILTNRRGAGLEPGLNCLRRERKWASVPSFPKSLSQAQNKYGATLESGFEGRAVTTLLGFSTCLLPVLPAP